MGKRKRSIGTRLGLGAGVALIGICAGWAAQAQAQVQAQNADTTLAPIVLQGEGESATGPVKGYVAKKSTTGSKTDTPLNEIPQAVSVVGKEEMDDRGVVNKVDEALRYTPGVVAAPYGTDPDTDWFYIRGFDATQTGVYLDGLNLFSYGFGGFQIDPFMLERVEVLKGPASVLYGGSNPGGIVNMVRKRPTDEPYYYTEIGINSNANAFGGFDISDKVGSSDTMTYRLTGKIAGGEGYTDFTRDFRGFIMPQLTISPDEATKFTVWAYYGGLDQVHTGNGFLPYEGTVVDRPGVGRIDRDFFPGEPDLDEGRYDQQMIGYELEHEFDGGWKFSSNFRYGHLDKYEFGPYPYLWASATALNRIGFEGDTTADNLAFDNRVENEFELGGATHNIMAGIDYRYYRIDNLQNFVFGSGPIDVLNPIYGLPQVPNGPLYDEVVTMNQLGFYAQDQIRFGEGWIVTLNGRYDYVHTDFDNKLNPAGSFKDSDGAWSGRAGLAYEFDNGLTPYVSAATFFNPLVGTGTAGPLKPEEGEQYEAGIKYEPTFFDGSLTASVFHIRKQNYTVSEPAPPFARLQLGEVESRGIELEAKVNIDENWKLLGSLTYTDVEVTKNPLNPAFEGKTPYIVPDITASLWLDYTVTQGALEGLSLGAGLRYKGESWADEANTLKVPDATVVDAAIRYKKDDWTASLNVTNLFDKTYVESCGGVGACGYGDARTLTFKLSKVW
ncbi:TonB-dependent siderophore receptor [Neorhizobium sp. CSC1952]|uniref:TonB-dependent siderophore receptor n=1 Tax=Neorhizobium sp. CSC1952 TaxID=2978974 RepID=UPI0025A59469|nr:TonB-dependent siderophore receptor [Rhizobium sp. CSC1952]WJR67055.1 TonB-dependent siderophore receptor [Rhizobium sp. CSC1952]